MPDATFNHTGGWQTFQVPEGVETIEVELLGAGSGNVRGGYVSGWMTVTPGVVMWLMVGRQGKTHSNRQAGDNCFGGGGPGGTGRGTGNGGDGGGGASAIRQGSAEGWVRCVAGGAGGTAGDGGDGGRGGAEQGAPGARGGAGSGGTGAATGGTQTGPGQGGTSSQGGQYRGEDGENGALAQGGKGGQVSGGNSHGGGGGGGGFRPGGGGNASGGGSPAGGGGAGSNYTGNLYNQISRRGDGALANGQIKLVWVAGPPPNQPPPPPNDIEIGVGGGAMVPLGDETTTMSMGSVTISGVISNPQREFTTMVVRLSTDWQFGSFTTHVSAPVGNVADDQEAPRAYVEINGLSTNTKYYARMFSVDSRGLWSSAPQADGSTALTYSQGSFWTNRPPASPELLTPTENRQFLASDNILFSWKPMDADEGDGQSGWEIMAKRIARPGEPRNTEAVFRVLDYTDATSLNVDAGTFIGNTFYVWQVRTADSHGVWSEWSNANSFYVIATTTPPVLLWPRREEAVVAGEAQVFLWDFLDPVLGVTQQKADLRYRVIGTTDWLTMYGDPDPDVPGSTPSWVIPQETFIEGYHYEWAARTTNSSSATSEWSDPEPFWAIATPGQGLVREMLPQFESVAPPLGCGVNRVFVYDRGGETVRGEITSISQLTYGRKRDDITDCVLFVESDAECAPLLAELRCWMHEIVIFRDGHRVWEGPITRIDAKVGQVEIAAKDVMVYLYRRIMRQGYNDTYFEIDGVGFGGMSVVRRASLTIRNALAYDDPNVLKWMTVITHSDDSIQHRAVPDFSKTAWEDVDDLAATAGLDYTVVGRRIILNDTHRPVGRLPEMRDGDFSEPLHVTEYGMQLANFFAVTNNNGVYGTAQRGFPFQGELEDSGRPLYYGWIEQLVSAYGETEGDEPDVLSREAQESLIIALEGQAERGINNRWPTPLVVRVPDNATINPTVNLGFDQLVPGVWVPVRAQGTLREVVQWQKLDSVTVRQTSEGETIGVVMSPAPNAGDDPDAGGAVEGESSA